MTPERREKLTDMAYVVIDTVAGAFAFTVIVGATLALLWLDPSRY